MIPDQLRRGDLLFVTVPPGEKGINIPGWNLVSNGLRWNDPVLSRHLSLGGNYGFYPAPGSSLLPLDIDDSEAFKEAGGEDLVAGCYCYSAHADRSKFRALVLCHDIPASWSGRKAMIKTHGSASPVLEIFFPAGSVPVFTDEIRDGQKIRIKRSVVKTGGQVIGPYSVHPNGNVYEPFDDKAPLKTVKWSDIMTVCDNIRPNSLEEHEPKNAHISREYAAPGRKLLRDRYNLSLWDYLPDDHYPSGNEIRGKSQFHGSTNERGNVAVNMEKGVYYCFRHSHGYDAAGIDAISRGIIECGQNYDGTAFKKHVAELERDFPEVRALEKEAWKRQKKAWSRAI